MKNKLRILIVVIAAALAAVLSTGQMALASTQPDEITSKMIELGIATEDQVTIIQNLENGIMPLSDTPNSIPVSSSTTIVSGFQNEKQKFSDGSIRIISKELPKNPLLRSTGLNACSVSSGTGYVNYVNCTVYNDTPLVTMGFIANFTLVQGGYNDYISNAVNPIATCRLGACSNIKAWVGKAQETTSGKAWAKMTADYILYGGAASTSYSLVLYVGANTYQLVG